MDINIIEASQLITAVLPFQFAFSRTVILVMSITVITILIRIMVRKSKKTNEGVKLK
jgi:hypothetical protein